MKRSIKVFDRQKKRAGCRTMWIYKTDKGEMSTKKLAKYLGVNQNSIAQWIRDAEGDVTDPKFVSRINGDEPEEGNTIGKANWEGLGKEPRTGKLNSIPSPGTLEEDEGS